VQAMEAVLPRPPAFPPRRLSYRQNRPLRPKPVTYDTIDRDWILNAVPTLPVQDGNLRGLLACDFRLRVQMRWVLSRSCPTPAKASEVARKFVEYLGCANASAGELRVQSSVALDVDYLDQSGFDRPVTLAEECSRELGRLISYLESPTDRGTPTPAPGLSRKGPRSGTGSYMRRQLPAQVLTRVRQLETERGLPGTAAVRGSRARGWSGVSLSQLDLRIFRMKPSMDHPEDCVTLVKPLKGRLREGV